MLFLVLDIEIPLKNINSSSRTPEVCGNTMGINWKVSVLPRPNYYCNQLRIYYNQMMVYVSSTAAASSMKQSSYTEVTLGLKHVKGGGYNKKLSSTVHHCITAPEENPFKLTFIIADIAVSA
jgi:hypothetical protein